VSFDKQFTRNHLQALCDTGRWNKTAPGPNLPKEIVNGTLAKYLEAYTRLTGRSTVPGITSGAQNTP
jgi:phosphoribosylaminoimidazole-succinocarboxamide synthase